MAVLSVMVMMSLGGCLRGPQRPSILLIGVESMGVDVVGCSAEPSESHDRIGFTAFCQEAIRFTHATTPSTMSQATWTSLLTAQYPYEHGVHDNGMNALSAKRETVAKAALRKGYRTGFFSGGPPLFRKSGLAQGFEVFEDQFLMDLAHPYLPARSTIERFLNWLADDVESDAFFGAIHLADLQFPDVGVLNENGLLQEKSINSQLDAVGQSLDILYRQMKKVKRWDSTTIILLGLNGPGAPSSLLSASTQVVLFVKPARSNGHEPHAWKIDRGVNLVDVGRTAFDILNLEIPESAKSPPLEAMSLAPLLDGSDEETGQNRFLVVESGWPKWREIGQLRAAVRKDPYLYVLDLRPKAFNTFVDRVENIPFPDTDADALDRSEKYSKLLRSLGYRPYEENSIRRQEFEMHQSVASGDYERLELWGPAARLALQNNDWEALERIAKMAKRPAWQYIASRNRNQPFDFQPKNICERLLLLRLNEHPRQCNDPVLTSLVSWVREKQDFEKRLLQEKFLSNYSRELLKRRIYQLNAAHFFAWDTDLSVGDEPLLTELFLALPENRKYQSMAKARSPGLAEE